MRCRGIENDDLVVVVRVGEYCWNKKYRRRNTDDVDDVGDNDDDCVERNNYFDDCDENNFDDVGVVASSSFEKQRIVVVEGLHTVVVVDCDNIVGC